MYMSSSGLSSAKRRRGVVHEKQPTFQSSVKQEPPKIPTANELLIMHERYIRKIHAKLEQLEKDLKELKEHNNKRS